MTALSNASQAYTYGTFSTRTLYSYKARCRSTRHFQDHNRMSEFLPMTSCLNRILMQKATCT
jgi:hypothetical protein